MIDRNLSSRYRLERRIGQGGMAEVHAGMDTVLRRKVAIKVLRPHLAADADFIARFYSEAQHAAKLAHPNIVNVYDVGREGDDYFIVMELVEGTTLAEMIEADGKLPEAVAIDFAAQICSGLAFAHRGDLLHRDVKPANILITRDDVVKLSDFGIARAVSTQTMGNTQPGLVMGSVYYLSPEQAQGHELDETSDLYSLGVVLYQMLTGELPYRGDTAITVALKHISSPIPEIDPDVHGISPALAAIVHKLLAKDPRDRYSSAGEVAKALREAREQPNVSAARIAPGSSRRPVPPRRFAQPKPRPAKYPDRPVAASAAVDRHDEPDDLRDGREFGGEHEYDDDFEGDRRPRRMLLWTLLATALAIAIVVGYVASRGSTLFTGPISARVAGVIGEDQETAMQTLEGEGYRTSIVASANDRVPSGQVFAQEPAAGSDLAAHGLVTLDVSSGIPQIQLIDMRQYSSDDASRYLRNAKLVPMLLGHFDSAPRGTVLAQRPAAGSSVAIHSKVTLTISKGPQPVSVPDIASQTLDDATNSLRGRGLSIAIAERVPSDQIVPGVVLSQNPAAGSPVSPGSTVAVTVSIGVPTIAIPDVGGKSASDASATLQRAGFRSDVEYVVDPGATAGAVLKQTPDRGSQAKKNATITLSIAEPGIVPDVTGRSPGDAAAALAQAGYAVGATTLVTQGTAGAVVRTDPAAGASLQPGQSVSVFVGAQSGQ